MLRSRTDTVQRVPRRLALNGAIRCARWPLRDEIALGVREGQGI